MKPTKTKPLIAVGLSGGVDSAVAAYLLKKQGYNCFGVFMVNVDEKQTIGVKCSWEDDYASAKQVADKLRIPLYSWNFVNEYKKEVLKDFFDQYKHGHTPNPDIWCNEKIKFGIFLKKALAAGATHVATGHYAWVNKIEERSKTMYQLWRGIEPNKDQSYFLYRANQFTLAHSIFPLGKMNKPEVRKLAAKIKLPNAKRPDSQGICFIGEVRIFDFLKQHLKQTQGSIVDEHGRKLGTHKGSWFYTLGQREGMGLTNGPWYVYEIDVKKNVLRVTKNPQDKRLYSKEFVVDQIHWVSDQAPIKPLRCVIEVRYHQIKPRQGTVQKIGRRWVVKLKQAERAVTAGQHAVFYKGSQIIGGGVIGKTKVKT